MVPGGEPCDRGYKTSVMNTLSIINGLTAASIFVNCFWTYILIPAVVPTGFIEILALKLYGTDFPS